MIQDNCCLINRQKYKKRLLISLSQIKSEKPAFNHLIKSQMNPAYINYHMEIEARQIISHDQSKTIIEFFFKNKFDFEAVVQKHKSKHSPTQIIDHIKRVFKKLILDMEYELMVTQKIKNMQLTENNTPEMFDRLLNFSEFLSADQISDFAIYYRNRVSRVTVYQTDLICSDKRLGIYNAFINYAIDHDLFRFALYRSRPSTYNISGSQMCENPMGIYPSQALELVYQYFSNALHTMNNCRFFSNNGNSSEDTNSLPQSVTSLTPSIERQIRRDGRYTTPKFFGEMLQHNLKNLFLIGLYRVYKSAMRSGMRSCYSWQMFSHKFLSALDMFDLTWKGVLMRIAIYDDPTMPQQIFITKHIYRKNPQAKVRALVEGPIEVGASGGVTATGISFGKETRVDRQIRRKRNFMMAKIREEMWKLISISRIYWRNREKAPKFISLVDD